MKPEERLKRAVTFTLQILDNDLSELASSLGVADQDELVDLRALYRAALEAESRAVYALCNYAKGDVEAAGKMYRLEVVQGQLRGNARRVTESVWAS
jgi:hypothetical protein